MCIRKPDTEMYAKYAGADICISSTNIDMYKRLKNADTRNEISGC